MQIIAKHLAHNVFNRRTHFAGHQFVFGLAAEFWLGDFHRQHATQSFAHVVASYLNLGFFCKLMFFNVFVDHTGHRRTQTREVRATVALRNIVGETKHALVIAIIPLHGYFNANVGARNAAIGLGRALPFCVECIGVQNFFARVNELYKALDTARTRIVV